MLKNKYPSIGLPATSPLRSAQTELQNTIAQHQQRRKKSPGTSSITPLVQTEPDSTAKRRHLRDPKSVAHANQLFKRNLCLPEKNTCFVQILTFKPYLGCSCSSAICATMSCKTQSELQHSTAEQVSLLYATLLYSTLLSSTEHYSTLLLLYSTRLCSTLRLLLPLLSLYSGANWTQ